MIESARGDTVAGLFPQLAADGDLFDRLLASAAIVSLDAGQTVCHQGSQCTSLPLVLSGNARVFRLGESGREITLYRIGPGQSCVLTASCILNGVEFPAVAVCESAVEAAVVPVAEVLRWEGISAAWRSFLLSSVGSRLAEMIALVDEVVFRRMDQRLAEYLLEFADSAGELRHTHQQIAADLGSSREVVTRILRDFENRGILRTGRGVIEVGNPAKLDQIAKAAR